MAQGNEPLGVGEIFKWDAHASVLGGEAQEAPNAKDEGDVEAGDAKRGQRLADDATLHPLEQCHNPARISQKGFVSCLPPGEIRLDNTASRHH